MNSEPNRFSNTARAQLAAAEGLYCSAASAWESAIQRASGKLHEFSLECDARAHSIAELACQFKSR